MKLQDSIFETLMDMLGDASPEAIKRARLLIEKNTKISPEVREKLTTAIDAVEAKISKGETPEPPEDLVDALAVDGMAEYIDSIKEEAFKAGEAHQIALKDKESENKENEEEEEKEAEAKDNDRQKDVLIDSLVNNAVALRISEINLEDMEGSSNTYRDSLKDKSIDELKSLYKDSSAKMTETFINTPLASLDNETLSEEKPDGLETEDEEKPMSDAGKVVKRFMSNDK